MRKAEKLNPVGVKDLGELLLQWAGLRTEIKSKLSAVTGDQLLNKVFTHPVTGEHGVIESWGEVFAV